ncbi:ATP-grasp domain-containing protein [Streptomyces sp. NBC_01335]|uniref:ATP-grasp domain-containing protein n=1 Tax=Streptomyces sp. NBC_01335 TaxID=2903828 RepID=UPI002E112764|nr:ATP-grasp domain-containing protein [Streptomyces sp. NBC_01335]
MPDATDTARPTAVLLNPRDAVLAAAERLGLAVVLVVDPGQPRPPATGDPEIETTWTADSSELITRLRERTFPGPVSCFGFGEIGASVAAVVNGELGWPGNPPHAPAVLKNKADLRALVGDKAGAPVAYALAATRDDLLPALTEVGFPCVAKPVDGTGSSGVQYLADVAEAEAYTAALDWQRPLLVEEFLEGTEYSVEAMSSDTGHRILAVTEKRTTGAPHFVETGHTLPVRLTDTAERAIAELVGGTLDAAGHRFGTSHTEVMVTAAGPRLIESHGRPGGDRISDMLHLALGEDVFAQSMAAVFGLPVQQAPSRDRVAGIRYVTFDGPVPEGGLRTELVASLPGVEEVRITAPAGQLPGAVTKSGDRHGFVLAVADTRDELEGHLDAALRTLTAGV